MPVCFLAKAPPSPFASARNPRSVWRERRDPSKSAISASRSYGQGGREVDIEKPFDRQVRLIPGPEVPN